MSITHFKLDDDFINGYEFTKEPFGFNGLGKLVYLRTYSRTKTDGTNEKWFETIKRVVEGTYNIQQKHILNNGLKWEVEKAQLSAQEMYDRMFNLKFLPPGRGLWAMGTNIIEERGLGMALNNCAFCSTEDIEDNLSEPFCFLMDASMLGVGVGFDTLGANQLYINTPDESEEWYQIPDTREGWVDSLRLLLESYFIEGRRTIKFDYSIIRPAGELIRGFGGKASGHKPLKEMHREIRKILTYYTEQKISSTIIVDIMNLIGKCVVAGNVRRTAEIALGEPDDVSYLDLKNYDVNPHRKGHGWTSNNSIFAYTGMDYSESAKRSSVNGEPGYFWLENAQKFGRMQDPPNFKDRRVAGVNPCGEQSLESFEMCCLVETFLNNHTSLNDYLRSLKFAYLYAKTVTLTKTHWKKTNAIMLRNRRIGTSVTGIAQFKELHGLEKLRDWLDTGYHEIQRLDTIYSEWLCIPESIKTTSVKPSGTVSLLGGATPGVHYPISRFYKRRVNIANNHELLRPIIESGLPTEPSIYDPNSTVVTFFVDAGEGIRSVNDVSMWEQVHLAAFLQRWWSDNQVSVTITFKKEEVKDINRVLDYAQYHLKSVSFMPSLDDGSPYEQTPYEAITRDQYFSAIEKIKEIDYDNLPMFGDGSGDRYCESDVCIVKEFKNVAEETARL